MKPKWLKMAAGRCAQAVGRHMKLPGEIEEDRARRGHRRKGGLAGVR